LTTADLAGGLALGPGQPNPFGSSIRIPYRAPERAGAVRLEILDVAGGLVCSLFRGQLSPGDHDAVWDGRNADGRPAPAGLYFSVLQAGPARVSRRVLLVR
jgi:hypothetical protein